MNPHELTIAEKGIVALAMDSWYGGPIIKTLKSRIANSRTDQNIFLSTQTKTNIYKLSPERASFLLALIMVQTP